MIISVASGKGGTGKTLVATSLALSLKESHKVQILDCDVEEPNDHILLRPDLTGCEIVCLPVPRVDEINCNYCGMCADVCAYRAIAVFPKNILVFPQLCHGCGACGYLCPVRAISYEPKEIGMVETGDACDIHFVHGKLSVGEPMPVPVIKRVKKYILSQCVNIIDVSPGTSCPMVASVRNSDFCLLVTEPTPFGLHDLKLAVAVVKELQIPCGVVLNRAGVGDSGVEDYCRKEDIPVMLTIPFDMEIARLYSRGITLAEGMPQWKVQFVHLFDAIQERAREGNRCPKR